MVKTLVKKQFFESFRSYFVNNKTGKRRSKLSISLWFIFFTFLMLFLCGVFFGLGYAASNGLSGADYHWIYFVLFGIIGILLGTFGSVFNTYAALYQAKDNDLLLSMPIPPMKILAARMVSVYLFALLYSGVVWLPCLVADWIFGQPTAVTVVFGVILLFVISLFVSVLCFVLGWVVALIASKIKNKSFITVIMTVLFFGVYYFLTSQVSDLIEAFLSNKETVGNVIKNWAYFLYMLGRGADGHVISMLAFCGITILLFVICFIVMEKSFYKLTLNSGTTSRRSNKAVSFRSRSLKSALFRREVKRYTSSATYMLNCTLGILFMPACVVLAWINKKEILQMMAMFTFSGVKLGYIIPMIITVVMCLIVAVNVVSTPSISLEGKNLWILRTLPVSGRQVLEAKLNLHVSLNVWVALICTFALERIFAVNTLGIILSLVFVWMYIWFTGAFGLMIGVLRPNFIWTNETAPIKQSLNVVIVMLVNVLIIAAMGFILYKVYDRIALVTYFEICTGFMVAAAGVMNVILRTKGAQIFDRL